MCKNCKEYGEWWRGVLNDRDLEEWDTAIIAGA